MMIQNVTSFPPESNSDDDDDDDCNCSAVLRHFRLDIDYKVNDVQLTEEIKTRKCEFMFWHNNNDCLLLILMF